jgi:hydroxypyruvate reductase/glycerate 2-kinase
VNETHSSYKKSTREIKTKLDRIIEDAIKAVSPDSLVNTQLSLSNSILRIQKETIDLDLYKKIHVLGAGKGTPLLFKGLEKKIGERISGGLIVSVKDQTLTHPKVNYYAGSHPIPDSSSINAGKAMVEYIRTKVEPQDLVFFLITGGASALLVKPKPPLTLKDLVRVNKMLLESGAGINEINCVRKHLSQIKGGKLAKMIYPARLISLIISDIINSPLENIGSGPTIGDPSSIADASHILHKYSLVNQCPPPILQLLSRSLKKNNNKISTTEASRSFKKNLHFILADNIVALKAAQGSAETMGMASLILTSKDKGEAVKVSRKYAGLIQSILCSKSQNHRPILFLSGGELTVTVKGKGKGGRNQEFILALLDELKNECRPFFIMSIGTDGIDGPTDAAGAWIDHQTMKKVNKHNLDIQNYLKNNNSYSFFKTINQLVKIGPTGTNVMDLRLFYLPE